MGHASLTHDTNSSSPSIIDAKFFREKIYNNRHMTVGRLRADRILNLLRDYEKQEAISNQTFQKGVNFARTQSCNTLRRKSQKSR